MLIAILNAYDCDEGFRRHSVFGYLADVNLGLFDANEHRFGVVPQNRVSAYGSINCFHFTRGARMIL